MGDGEADGGLRVASTAHEYLVPGPLFLRLWVGGCCWLARAGILTACVVVVAAAVVAGVLRVAAGGGSSSSACAAAAAREAVAVDEEAFVMGPPRRSSLMTVTVGRFPMPS